MTLSLVSLLAASAVLAAPAQAASETDTQEALRIARQAAVRAEEAGRAAEAARIAAEGAAQAAAEARQAALKLGVSPSALLPADGTVVLAQRPAVTAAPELAAPAQSVETAPAPALTSALPKGLTLGFNGYARTSMGTSTEGGNQACFGLPGVSKWRMGNECDTYAEFTPTIGFPIGESGIRAVYTATIGYYNPEPMMTNGAEPANFDLRQNWIGFTGFDGWLEGATIWGGRRYYQRHDTHNLDFFYWSQRGQGVGIEHIQTPLGKLSVALLRNYNNTGPSFENFTNGVAGNSIDVRLAGIQTNRDGTLEIGVEARTADAQGTAKAHDGYLLTAEHVQKNLFGGTNTLAVQYGDGAGANLSTNDGGAYLFTTDNTSAFRVMDQFLYEPTPQFSALFGLVYEKSRNFRFDDRVISDREWFSIGGRPMWHWSDNISSAVEVGYDRLSFGDDPMGVLSNRDASMTKVTIAPVVVRLGRGFFNRPELRLFGTCARWNGDADAVALANGRAGGSVTDNSNFAGRRDGCSAGVHLEAWW